MPRRFEQYDRSSKRSEQSDRDRALRQGSFGWSWVPKRFESSFSERQQARLRKSNKSFDQADPGGVKWEFGKNNARIIDLASSLLIDTVGQQDKNRQN